MVAASKPNKIQVKTVNLSSEKNKRTNRINCMNKDCSLTKSAVLKNQCGLFIAGKNGLIIKNTITMCKTIVQKYIF